MPFLEQRRKPHFDVADALHRLTALCRIVISHSPRNWPLVWSLIYLAGFGLGGKVPLEWGTGLRHDSPAPLLLASRAATLTPVLLAMVPPAAAVPVWLAVFGGGFVAGSTEAHPRKGRVSAVSDNLWSVSRFLVSRQPTMLRITGWPSLGTGQKWRAPARIVRLDIPTDGELEIRPRVGQGIWLSGKGKPPVVGTVVTGMVDFRVPPGATIPGGFDFRTFLSGRGLGWQGRLEEWTQVPVADPVAGVASRILHPVRNILLAGIASNLPGAEAKLSAAVLLGIRTPDSRAASKPFADLGLAHLFAVSGLHVGILLGIILLPGQLAGLSPWQKMIPLVVILPIYVLLTGIPGSVVRAASLGFVAVAAGAVGRPVDSLRVIGLLFWAGTIWDPGQNLDMGLKLSYLAAGGILAVSSLTGGLSFSSHRMGGPVLTGLAVSGAAQWFTLPLVAGSFGRISLLSPLANLLAVPVFGLAIWCVVLSLLLNPLWGFGAQSAASLGWILLRSLSGLTNVVSQLSGGFPIGLPSPGPSKIFIWMILTLLGLVALQAKRRGTRGPWFTGLAMVGILSAGLLMFGPCAWQLNPPSKITAWQFDVGQGDCAVLVFPDGWSMMIDTAGRFGFNKGARDGPLARNVIPFLSRHGVSRFDAVVLTHGHLDHTGGSEALGENFHVGRWLVSGRAHRAVPADVDSTFIQQAEAGIILHRWQEWEVGLVFPPPNVPTDFHENDYSQVVVLRREGKAVAVWSGDLETAGERLLLQEGLAPADVQVWKAGHHGSNTSGSQDFLDILQPGLVVVSCGVGNGYGHPNHGPYVVAGDTLDIVRTDLQGSLRFEWSREGILEWDSIVGSPNLAARP